MITLKRNGPLMRWAYKWNKPGAFLDTDTSFYNLGNSTTLCDVFWRSVLVTPLKFLLIGVPLGGLTVMLLMAFLQNPREFVFVASMVILCVVMILTLIAGVVYIVDHRDHIKMRETLVGEFVMGVKHNYCPVVKLED